MVKIGNITVIPFSLLIKTVGDILKGVVKVVQAVVPVVDEAAPGPVLPIWAWALVGASVLLVMVLLTCALICLVKWHNM